MLYETKKRSILKAVSWRVCATLTTALIVFLFTGKISLALTVGFLEVIAKMALYFFHERLWHKIHYGKKEIPAFVLWFTGLPASGKKNLADEVYAELKQNKLKVDRIDSMDVRPLFPETGFTSAEVERHVRRCGHLAGMLERNGVIVVASFVSPFLESRKFVRGLATNFVEVYLKSTPEACAARDTKDRYRKAYSGEFKNFPGVHFPYEESFQPEICIEVDRTDTAEARRQIIQFLRKKYLNGSR